jgi:polyhydroxyalkanoate synthase
MSKPDNSFNPTATPAAWMTQMADPQAWQSLLKLAHTSAPALPVAPPASVQVPPEKLAELQKSYMEEMGKLWTDMVASHTPAVKDRRFNAEPWHTNPLYTFNAAAYLLNARFMNELADSVDADPKTKKKIRFATQQAIDAMSPSNFLFSNPAAQQKIIETKGESLTKGIMHMIADMQKGHISQTDENAFEVGRNVATSEGSVVYENEVIQLIQYRPLTKQVHQRPLLIVPPCINKFYILDLQPENSLIRYAVEQGHTVFVVSWINADESHSHLTWDDYIQKGAMDAIAVAQDISGQKQINALGFCVGGTILATAVAVMTARGKSPISSLTLLTTMLDFTDVGVIDVYVDETQVAQREQSIGAGGLMPGRDFAATFSSLRPNDLIWNYVESNYLKGEDPPPFDLLYWNSDSTNLPGPMFCYYLRNMYLENNLRLPNRLSVGDEKIDLGKVKVPTFIYASREDHIVPWATSYASTALLNAGKRGNMQFVLGASGHIAGVINPPAKKKRSYWTNAKLPATANEWLAGAKEHPGSWWTTWSEFLSSHAGELVNAPRKYGNTRYKPIEPAPGRYVKMKAE